MSALGKSLFTVLFAVSLVVASCNTNTRSKEVRVKDNGKDMSVKERVNNDSVNIKRDRTIDNDNNGNSKTVTKEEKKVDKSNGNQSSTSSTNSTTNKNR